MRVSKQGKLRQSSPYQGVLGNVLASASKEAQYGNSHSSAGDNGSKPVGNISITSGET
jgi:hypothetical protein